MNSLGYITLRRETVDLIVSYVESKVSEPERLVWKREIESNYDPTRETEDLEELVTKDLLKRFFENPEKHHS